MVVAHERDRKTCYYAVGILGGVPTSLMTISSILFIVSRFPVSIFCDTFHFVVDGLVHIRVLVTVGKRNSYLMLTSQHPSHCDKT